MSKFLLIAVATLATLASTGCNCCRPKATPVVTAMPTYGSACNTCEEQACGQPTMSSPIIVPGPAAP